MALLMTYFLLPFGISLASLHSLHSARRRPPLSLPGPQAFPGVDRTPAPDDMGVDLPMLPGMTFKDPRVRRPRPRRAVSDTPTARGILAFPNRARA